MSSGEAPPLVSVIEGSELGIVFLAQNAKTSYEWDIIVLRVERPIPMRAADASASGAPDHYVRTGMVLDSNIFLFSKNSKS